MRTIARAATAALLLSLVLPGAAFAATRMPIGFQDDPSFRWSPNAATELDRVQAAHASIIRTIVDWRAVAPRRPRNAASPFDKAYRLGDLDQMLRNAQQRGMQVMITIWGTPKWANGGKSPNVAPKRLTDLTNFARAVATRYSGRYAGYPYVGRYSVWNEPNLGIFLSPQFDAKGKIISPRTYANLYRAARKGIKAGNRGALVAIGETSNQGRDHKLRGINDSVAPGTFARLLAAQKGLAFDAYATHPYPTRPSLPPTQKVRWPNVTLTQLKRFETSIDQWFHRRNIPVWITEYGYETKPAEPHGVTNAKQAAYLGSVARTLRADPRVHMLIWFIFRDSKTSLWQSGLYSGSGAQKPAFKTFSALARVIAGESLTVKKRVTPTVNLPVPAIAATSAAGTSIDIDYQVFKGSKRLVDKHTVARMLRSQSVTFRPAFKPAAGARYTLRMDAGTADGETTTTTYDLVATK
jgi:hypothetical protein